MKTVRNGRSGFTLLELLMVVVIIAILASIAVPQYIRTVERARQSEAVAMLGQLRNAAIRFRAEFNNSFAGLDVPITGITRLDVNPTDVQGTPLFAYTIPCANANQVVIVATRVGATAIGNCVASYVIDIDEAGVINGRGCQSVAPIGTCT